jgi:hypothetical protein
LGFYVNQLPVGISILGMVGAKGRKSFLMFLKLGVAPTRDKFGHIVHAKSTIYLIKRNLKIIGILTPLSSFIGEQTDVDSQTHRSRRQTTSRWMGQIKKHFNY